MKTLSRTFQLVIFGVGLMATSSWATVRYVNLNSPSPAAPYTSWATAATNIQTVINFASNGDQILVTNGVYSAGQKTLVGSTSNLVAITKLLLVRSVNGPAVTVLRGHQQPGTNNSPNAIRCVYMINGATLSGFTLMNGMTYNENGGGVYCSSTNEFVTNCVIAGNIASQNGGGAFSGTLINCVLTENSATNFAYGGGAYQSTLINCALYKNRVGYRGGGAGFCTLINCTLVNNFSHIFSGGVENCTLKNSIVYYNLPNNFDSSQPGATNCCLAPLPFGGKNNFTNQPGLVDWAAGNLRLQIGSPCIDAGTNALAATTNDLDNNPRITGGAVDVGAYENQFSGIAHYVSLISTNPVAPYTNWLTAATNIQDAVDVASAGEPIIVNDGVYKTGGRVAYGTLSNRVSVNKAIAVQSLNGPILSTIEGLPNLAPVAVGDGVRCVYLTNGATLSGFTLTNGGTLDFGDTLREQSGAGVWCEGSDVVVANCIFRGNRALMNGGGAFGGTLMNCVLTNNFAVHGGGAYSNTLISCILVKNFASFQNLDSGGGVIYGTLSNCLLVANRSSGGGGGAAFSRLTSCVLSNNSGINGGAVCLATLDNCLISSNRASLNGGGAYSNLLVNCILKNNSAGTSGGGGFGSVLLNCTVVTNIAGNGVSSGDGGGICNSGASNCIVYHNLAESGRNFFNSTLSYCDALPLVTGFGNISNNPAFLNLAGPDFHLQSNSPCINAGKNSYAVAGTDYDGLPRIAGGTVDIGAFEFQSPTSILSYAWAQQYGLPINGSADNTDSDGDGLNNSQEWHVGTDPTNSASILQMSSPGSDPSGVIVTWQSVSRINYLIDRSTNLMAQPAFQTIATNIPGLPNSTTYTDISATNGGPYFYRVGVP